LAAKAMATMLVTVRARKRLYCFFIDSGLARRLPGTGRGKRRLG
jgi:hypothetical protein